MRQVVKMTNKERAKEFDYLRYFHDHMCHHDELTFGVQMKFIKEHQKILPVGYVFHECDECGKEYDNGNPDEWGYCPDCVDVNQDGSISPADALCIFYEYLRLPSCLNPASGSSNK